MPLTTTEYVRGDQHLVFDRPMFRSERDFAFHVCSDPFMRVDSADIGKVSLHRVRSTGHSLALDEPGLFTLLLPRQGNLKSETGRNRIDAGPGTLVACGPGARKTTVRAGRRRHFEADGIVLPRECLTIDRCPDLVVGSALAGAAFAISSALRFVTDLVDQPAGTPVNQKMLKLGEAVMIEAIDAYLGALAGAADDEGLRSRTHAPLVRRAERIMAEEYQDEISMTDLATRLGVSTRTLQSAFATVHGITPREFLSGFRLDRAREMLARSAGQPSVTSVAHDCGFAHLGRFATAYRRRFGERPSDTLRR